MSAGNITRRGEKSYRIKYDAGPRDPLTGKRKIIVETVRGSRRDAQRLLTRRLREIDTGVAVNPSRVTVAEHLRHWLDAAKPRLAGKTHARYTALAEQQIIPHLGAVAVQKLAPKAVMDWHTTLLRAGGVNGRPLAARTVGHAHRLLHTVLGNAVTAELVGRNAAINVHPPTVDAEEPTILGAEEITALLAGLAGHRLLPIAAVAVGAGLRRSEICGLCWDDISLDDGWLRVSGSLERTPDGLRIKKPKTRYGRRRVSLPEFTVAALRGHWRQQQEQRLALGLGRAGPEDLVFTLDDGGPFDPDYLSRHWLHTLTARGLPRSGLHGLRHSHASALIAANIDPLMVSRRLGHSTAAFTLSTYAHLFDASDGAAARAIDATLRPKR